MHRGSLLWEPLKVIIVQVSRKLRPRKLRPQSSDPENSDPENSDPSQLLSPDLFHGHEMFIDLTIATMGRDIYLLRSINIEKQTFSILSYLSRWSHNKTLTRFKTAAGNVC